jgi:chromosome segregation ATPase
MSGGSNIRAIGSDAAQDAPAQSSDGEANDPLALEDQWMDNEIDELQWDESGGANGRDLSWLSPAFAMLSAVAWTTFYAWALQGEILSGGTPDQWIGWVINWSVPVLLIVSLLMLSMRMSTREATRFGDAATLLSNEAAALETRLSVVNRELSLARDFLSTQTRELESLGRVASDRLSKRANELQGLIKTNGDQVEAIAGVSQTALGNMEKLRDDLPVVANSARDVSNQVGNAGRTAHEQLEKLIAGFGRLNDFGKATGSMVTTLSDKVGITLSAFEKQVSDLEKISAERFEALKAKSDDFRADLDGREVDALAAMRRRADEVRSGLNNLQGEFAKSEEQSLGMFEKRVSALQEGGGQVAAALRNAEDAAFEALSESKERLLLQISEVISEIDNLDQSAIATSQARIRKLHDDANQFEQSLAARDAKFNEELARRQSNFETRESQASEVLAQRMAELDEALAERREAQIRDVERLVAHGEEIAEKVSQLNSLFEKVASQAEAAQTTVGNGLGQMTAHMAGNHAALEETSATLSTLTDASVRLLEIIQSGAKQSREDLPQAIASATQQLEDVEGRAALLSSVMDDAGNKGASLSDYVISTEAKVEQIGQSIEEHHSRLASYSELSHSQLVGLQKLLSELEQQNIRLSERTQDDLRNAIDRLDEATKAAFATVEHGSADNVSKVADQIGSKAVEAVEKSLRTHSAEAIGKLEQAAAHASGVGREAAIQLRDQLALVNELTGNLEQRVSRAREQAEDQVNNDFARRMALITDSLNSNAIDIAKSLSSEISDTAWASYLKGDRGIFTRRAVRLIDNGEAREIVELYQNDDSFREDVARYIHDFEGMLRSVLSTRDGNAMGVTLLSSDMGKLYVALAQAIERFRN